jgi:hypothetical protein
MARRALRIVNQSSYQSARVTNAVDVIARAIAVQLRDVARAWGAYVWDVVDDANEQGFAVVLLDDADAAGALGYHDVNENDGTPYARVFVNPVLEHRGTWLRGANSVAVTASHEACELVGDPAANHWVETPRGVLVAQELCDPVENCAYTVRLRDGRQASVSDFVYPEWFNGFAPASAQFDHLRAVRKPYEIAPKGYVIHRTRAGVRNVYGRTYPRWRTTGKRVPGARTYARHRMG